MSPEGNSEQQSEGDSDRKNRSDRKSRTAAWAASTARDQLEGLVGQPVEQVIGVEKNDDGWKVQAEIIEMRRIPDSSDILALYEVRLDQQGELTGYKRTERYSRGRSRD